MLAASTVTHSSMGTDAKRGKAVPSCCSSHSDLCPLYLAKRVAVDAVDALYTAGTRDALWQDQA